MHSRYAQKNKVRVFAFQFKARTTSTTMHNVLKEFSLQSLEKIENNNHPFYLVSYHRHLTVFKVIMKV